MEIDKINVGMYVRTLNGIVKIDKIQNDVMKDTKGCLHYGDFIKARHNIIDLIEVGDYVNGCLIVEIKQDPFIKGQINLWTNMILSAGEPFPNEYYKAKILEKDIKTIVTKEQFESISYKVGD